MPRAKSRTDPNHVPIREGLRELGYLVIDTHKFGSGFPDMISVSRTGRVALWFEVKAPWDHPEWAKPDVTEMEVRFMMKMVSSVYRIVDDVQQAADVMAELDRGEF